MPLKNLHTFRVKSPNSFSGKLATKSIAPGISILHGFLKGKTDKGRVVQSYRFSVKKYSYAEAKKWMSDHKIKYIRTEKAVSNEIVTLAELARRLSRKLDMDN